MPTYRRDLHLGHEVPLIGSDDIMSFAIKTWHLEDGCVTMPKLADDVIKYIRDSISDVLQTLQPHLTDLQNQIDAISKSGGTAISNEFGDNPHIGISQKTLTEEIIKIKNELRNITGESHSGIDMTITPEFYTGDSKCEVHITAVNKDEDSVFSHITVYINDIVVAEGDNQSFFEWDTIINGSSVVRCEATIKGMKYTAEKTIEYIRAFYVGAGSTFTDVIKDENMVSLDDSFRASCDVTFKDNDHLFIIMDSSLRGQFIRADMNSFEIPFTESTEVVDNIEYSVFTSNNTYRAGTYNIDING